MSPSDDVHGPLSRRRTWGGLQLASDVVWRSGWRIQRSAWSGAHRLLDPRDRRCAQGSLEQCRAALDTLRPRETHEHVVVLLHGLGRTRRSLRRIDLALRAAGLTTAALSLASTRAPIEAHAADLRAVLANLDARRVSFVTHSLGAIVLRTALAAPGALPESCELGRAVLIAPPSRGSALSRRLASSALTRPFFRAVMGPTGIQLGTAGAELPPPPCPFAIVTGARGNPRGWNPLITGDDDGIVTAEETRLEGAAAELALPRLHTVVMRDPRVVAATVRFVVEGRLDGSPGSETAL